MFQFVDKSYYRRETNRLVSGKFLSGTVVDLGGGKRSSYLNYFTKSQEIKAISLNSNKEDKPSIATDLEKKIPLPSSFADFVLAFNLFEHINNELKLALEVRRILKAGGVFYAVTPFLKEFLPWNEENIPKVPELMLKLFTRPLGLCHV